MPENTQICTLHRQCSQLKRRLTDFDTFIINFQVKEVLSAVELKELEERIVRVTPIIKQLDSIYSTLCEVVEQANLNAESDYFAEFEQIYFEIIAKAKTLFEKNSKVEASPVDSLEGSVQGSNNASTSSNNVLNSVRLPTISLQKFNGQHIGWLKFHGTFVSLIHDNESLSNVKKFHYLNASLEGDAADIVKSLHLSSDNYKIA